MRVWALGCFHGLDQYPNLSEGADRKTKQIQEKDANSDGDSSQLHSTPRLKKPASSTAETDGKELSFQFCFDNVVSDSYVTDSVTIDTKDMAESYVSNKLVCSVGMQGHSTCCTVNLGISKPL